MNRIVGYLNKFLEVGVLLLAVSVIAEILFGPNVAFFGTQVTSNLISLLNSLSSDCKGFTIGLFIIFKFITRLIFKFVIKL